MVEAAEDEAKVAGAPAQTRVMGSDNSDNEFGFHTFAEKRGFNTLPQALKTWLTMGQPSMDAYAEPTEVVDAERKDWLRITRRSPIIHTRPLRADVNPNQAFRYPPHVVAYVEIGVNDNFRNVALRMVMLQSVDARDEDGAFFVGQHVFETEKGAVLVGLWSSIVWEYYKAESASEFARRRSEQAKNGEPHGD